MWMRFSPIAYGFGNARDTALTGTFRTDNAVVRKLAATEIKGICVAETKRTTRARAGGCKNATVAMANLLRTRNSLRVKAFRSPIDSCGPRSGDECVRFPPPA